MWVRHRARGQTLALAAVAMVAAIGSLAMVVDMGMFWVIQRQFQAAADAGALAGAWYDPICPAADAPPCATGSAITTAQQVASFNGNQVAGLCGGAVAANASVGTTLNVPAHVNAIVVTVDCYASYSFGRILGLRTMHVSASAAAALGDRVGCPPTGGDITDLTDPRSAPCPFPANPQPYIARLIE